MKLQITKQEIQMKAPYPSGCLRIILSVWKILKVKVMKFGSWIAGCQHNAVHVWPLSTDLETWEFESEKGLNLGNDIKEESGLDKPMLFVGQ